MSMNQHFTFLTTFTALSKNPFHMACFHRKLKNVIYGLIPFKVPVETEANWIIGDQKNVYHNHLLEVVIAVLIHLKSGSWCKNTGLGLHITDKPNNMHSSGFCYCPIITITA